MVPAALKNVLVERQWVGHVDKHGKPFASFEAFATHRLWQGLETTIDDLRVHCRKHPEVYRLLLAEIEKGATHSEAGAKGGRGKKAGDNVTSFKRGNGALYTLKRLKRDRPDLFQVVLGGGMTANAAAIEAGFRKQATPLERIRKLLPKLSAAERGALVRELIRPRRTGEEVDPLS